MPLSKVHLNPFLCEYSHSTKKYKYQKVVGREGDSKEMRADRVEYSVYNSGIGGSERERGKRKEERGKRKEERGKRKEERGKRKRGKRKEGKRKEGKRGKEGEGTLPRLTILNAISS
jgi:hypothetical protein